MTQVPFGKQACIQDSISNPITAAKPESCQVNFFITFRWDLPYTGTICRAGCHNEPKGALF